MFSKKEKGMTIVEMLVVLFIIAIILSIIFVGYRGNQQGMILDSAAYKLAADIRRVEGMAGLDNAICKNNEDFAYAYGLNFPVNKGSYILFSDCNNDGVFSDTIDATVDEIVLNSGVKMNNTTVLNIVFIPPGPSVLINNNQSIDELSIGIGFEPGVSLKTVKVNKTGMIDID